MPSDRPLVWLASYPKSGNTWLRLLLANLISGSDVPESINGVRLPGSHVVSRNEIEEVTLIDSGLLTRAEMDRLRPQLVAAISETAEESQYLKIHDAYVRNPGGEPILGRGCGRAVLYIVRDPRDVAVSLSFHLNRSLDRTIMFLNSDSSTLAGRDDRMTGQIPQTLLSWSGHVASWTEQTDLPVHVLRYEDLRADTVAAFAAAVAFLGLEVPEGALERAVHFADFSELQRQECEKGFAERSSQSIAPFFRMGRAGAWTEALSPDQCDAIVAAHRPMMERFGYL